MIHVLSLSCIIKIYMDWTWLMADLACNVQIPVFCWSKSTRDDLPLQVAMDVLMIVFMHPQLDYTLPNLKPFAWYCLRLDSNENTQMKQFRRNTRSRLDSKNTGSTFDGWNLPHLGYNKKYCNYRETTYQHRLVWRVGLSTHSFPLRLLFVFIYKMLHNSSFYLQTMYIYMYILPCHWIQSIYIYPFPTCL